MAFHPSTNQLLRLDKMGLVQGGVAVDDVGCFVLNIFTHLFSSCLLSSFYVPGTVIDIQEMPMNTRDTIPAHVALYSIERKAVIIPDSNSS